MNRKALIIYCTNTESGKLVGTDKDNDNIRKFLISDVGGQWKNDEVISLRDPTAHEIEQCLAEEFENVDYSFIVFSGHGGIDEGNSQDYLEVKDCDIPISMLISSAPKQALIIDACRSYYRRMESSLQKSFSNLNESIYIPQKNRITFDKAVNQAEEGLTILYSASENQSSLATDRGSAYIYSLLSICKEWERNHTNNNVLDLKDAHRLACEYLKKNFHTIQKPIMNIEKRKNYFPIAVKR